MWVLGKGENEESSESVSEMYVKSGLTGGGGTLGGRGFATPVSRMLFSMAVCSSMS